MPNDNFDVVVAGHICLDIILTPSARRDDLESIFLPGSLVEVGPAVAAPGGPVSNAGLALHRLGVPVRLVGKVGNDLFGAALLDLLGANSPTLSRDLVVVDGEATSYSIVISRPGMDRFFLHCAGANDTFSSDDLRPEHLAGARLFHFGYPPVMKRMYADDGRELEAVFRRIKPSGLTASLDMCVPDPETGSGRADWGSILKRVLPFVDIFMPSFEELLFMLDRERFDGMQVDGRGAGPTPALLDELSNRSLSWGAAIVALKLGDRGLYLRTTADSARLSDMGACTPGDLRQWTGREILAPCFRVESAGTTGAGDCTIAGFLTALLFGLSPEEAVIRAAAVGACCVEKPDATSGVPAWERVEERIRAGWERRGADITLDGWRLDAEKRIYFGPNDKFE